MNSIRDDAKIIIEKSIAAVLPEAAVKKALTQKVFENDIVIVAIGKAAWNMAKAAKDTLGEKVNKGIIITKYGHSKGKVESCEIVEAGHPVPDENSVLGTTKALELVSKLDSDTDILFLISGGGSALFEKPMEGVSLNDIRDITNQLLGCGADIVEINTIRKHLSAVKGGRFAQQCGDKNIYAIVLSDVVGDKLDTIASGPAFQDDSTSKEAFDIIFKYKIQINESVKRTLALETPKSIENCETVIIGNVKSLCEAAAINASDLGYAPLILTTSIDGEAQEAGSFLAAIAREIKNNPNNSFVINPPCAIIVGGETIVHLKGNGKGGRNQEVALSAAIGIEDLQNVVVFSVGSDGTDGPTDAAGGMVDGETVKRIRQCSILPEKYLEDNNSYNALKASGDLIITGATGTNVNDLLVVLCG